MKVKGKVKSTEITGVVYKIPSGVCDQSNVGETGRTLY